MSQADLSYQPVSVKLRSIRSAVESDDEALPALVE